MAPRPPATFTRVNHTTAITTKILGPLAGEITVYQPPPLALSSLIDHLWTHLHFDDAPARVTVYAEPDGIKSISNTLHATLAGDLIRNNILTIYELPHETSNTTPKATDGTNIRLFLQFGQEFFLSLTASSEMYHAAVTTELAEAASLDTPEWTPPDGSLSHMLDDFTTTFGPQSTAYRDLVATILNPGTTVQIDGDELVLLAGAIDQLQLYQLTEWAERIGQSSRSTLNRKKNLLVDEGILSITREPQDWGRPRQVLNIPSTLPDHHSYTNLLTASVEAPPVTSATHSRAPSD